jgi:nicotinamidase-related amidase
MHEIQRAAHLCIDMQNIFAPGGLWETPWMAKVLPAIEAVAARYCERTIFTRFITPAHADDRPGRWRHYFRRWEQATRRHLRGSELDLVPALARYAPPALVVDKPAYSAFMRSGLYEMLISKRIDTVVLTGAETDVCVLSTALSAVDLGFQVVIVEDALCSSSDEGHDALMTMYRTRMQEQIDVLTVSELFDLWPQE